MTNVPKSLTGVAGEHYVAYLLAKSGYAVGLTGRGTPHVDVLVTNPLNGKSMAIQVKTMRGAWYNDRKKGKRVHWRVGKAAYESANSDIYWAFVDL